MYSSPDCPRCGMSLEPFHTKFHEPFDTYWRCPYCHYSCNADLSRTDWHNIIANEVDWYAKQSVACKDKLNRYIHIGMDEADGMALILKFHNEFLNTTKDLHDNLSTLLSRSNKQTFRAKLDTVYGLTSYNFAKACTLLEQYKPAAQYIDEAMHYVPSDNVYFSTVLSLAEEIRQKNQVAITARPADARLKNRNQQRLPPPPRRRLQQTNPSRHPKKKASFSRDAWYGLSSCRSYF